MGFLEKVLPGYKGYREREDSRNSDKLLREFFTQKLRQGRDRYDRIKERLAREGKLDLLGPAEKVTQVLSRVTDRLQYANYGFSGRWFGKDKIDVERLDKVHTYDNQLASELDKLGERITELDKLREDGALRQELESLVNSLFELDTALDEREAILRNYGGQAETR